MLLLALATVFVLLSPAGAGAETVKVSSWDKLVAAVDAGATDIAITTNFQQNLSNATELVLRGGSVITLHTSSGKPYTFNAAFSVRGEEGGGTLILDQIDLQAPANQPALRVFGKDAQVQAANLTGSRSSTGVPIPVLIAEGNVRVSVSKITGAQGANAGAGGDGILAADQAQVEVGTVTAGDSKKGYGGTAICAAGDAVVTVTGDATGGAGLYAPGWAIRAAGNATVIVQGNATDGQQVESKKPVSVPEEADALAVLRYRVLRGDKEIALAPSFKYAERELTAPAIFCSQYWFTPEQEAVWIIGSEKAKKRSTFAGTQCFIGGSFVFDNIDLVSHSDGIIVKSPTGEIQWSGNISTNAKNADAIQVEDGVLTLTGTLVQEHKKGGSALVVSGKRASVNMFGSITGMSLTADTVTVTDGAVTLHGPVTQKGTTDGSALRVSGEDTRVTVFGEINTASPQTALAVTDANVEVIGNVTAKLSHALSAAGSAKVRIEGNLTNDGAKNKNRQPFYPCVLVTDRAECVIAGDVLSKSGPALSADGSSQLNVTGKVTATNNTAVEDNGSANITLNGTIQYGKTNYVMVALNGAGNVVIRTSPGSAFTGNWSTAGMGGNLILSSTDQTPVLPEFPVLPETPDETDPTLPETPADASETDNPETGNEPDVPDVPQEHLPVEDPLPSEVPATPVPAEETPVPVESTQVPPVETPVPPEETPVPTPTTTPANDNSTGLTYADVARLYGWDPVEAAAAGLNFIYIDYDESGHEIMTSFKPE